MFLDGLDVTKNLLNFYFLVQQLKMLKNWFDYTSADAEVCYMSERK